MTNSSSSKPFPNVPPPSGSKAGSPYTRFIPREELGDFQRWKPGDLDGTEPRARGRSRDGFAPTEEEWRGLVDEARQDGYQEGYRDGLSALESLRQSFVTQASSEIGSLVSAFDRQFDELETTMAQAVARSAVLLARQVLRLELASRPEVVARLAEQAIQAVQTSARHVVVHVHPDDLAFVAAGAAEVLQARGARVQADPSISRGGCSVRSDADTVDATLETRWANACAAMGISVAWSGPAPSPSPETAA
jgi:flagellar assembly protein FliH